MEGWPLTVEDLIVTQRALAGRRPRPWGPGPAGLRVGACFVCFPRGHAGAGAEGDPAWAGAALAYGWRPEGSFALAGRAGAPYAAGLLALREGPLLESAVRGLPRLPDVLLVNATGRDHPRRAGLALHLGAVLGVPTVGVTHRPLLADGAWPADRLGATSPLRISGELVGFWLRTRPGIRPLAVHAAWRTDPEAAAEVVRRCRCRRRTPDPLREARRAARTARAAAPTVQRA